MRTLNPNSELRIHGAKHSRERIKSVLFYSDAAEFGGHEKMTVEAMRSLCQNDKVSISVVFFAGNERLKTELAELSRATQRLNLIPSDFQAKSLQAFRSLISVRTLDSLKKLMKRVNPDVVFVSQGRIEAGSLGLLAAKRAGLATISYLPMAHSVSVSGFPVAVRTREMVNGYFYGLPDKIITISHSARQMLLERGATSNITVVPNGIVAKPSTARDREEFRTRHGIENGECAVGVIGRIDFRQKAQNFALEAYRRYQDRLSGYKLLFIGEGPDEYKLKGMIRSAGLEHKVQLLPWCNDTARVYAGLDMLLISSKFEGVPLVMLEAMSHRLPITASKTDGMAEFLPESWLFPFGNCQALADRLVSIRSADNFQLMENHWRQVREEFTMAKFYANMRAAVLEGTSQYRYSQNTRDMAAVDVNKRARI